MKLSEMVEPTQDVIAETKRAYNRILKRQQEAAKYLDDANVPVIERERHALAFRIEILDPMNSYLEVLKDWGVLVTDDEILGGLRIE